MGDDLVHEADPEGLVRIDAVSCQGQLHRLAEPDETGETLASASAGDDPDVDFRLAERRAARCDADVAGHGEFEAAAEAIAVDHRDDRLRQPVDRVIDRAVLVHAPLLHR